VAEDRTRGLVVRVTPRDASGRDAIGAALDPLPCPWELVE